MFNSRLNAALLCIMLGAYSKEITHKVQSSDDIFYDHNRLQVALSVDNNTRKAHPEATKLFMEMNNMPLSGSLVVYLLKEDPLADLDAISKQVNENKCPILYRELTKTIEILSKYPTITKGIRSKLPTDALNESIRNVLQRFIKMESIKMDNGEKADGSKDDGYLNINNTNSSIFTNASKLVEKSKKLQALITKVLETKNIKISEVLAELGSITDNKDLNTLKKDFAKKEFKPTAKSEETSKSLYRLFQQKISLLFSGDEHTLGGMGLFKAVMSAVLVCTILIMLDDKATLIIMSPIKYTGLIVTGFVIFALSLSPKDKGKITILSTVLATYFILLVGTYYDFPLFYRIGSYLAIGRWHLVGWTAFTTATASPIFKYITDPAADADHEDHKLMNTLQV